jgi:hypothetical protein
MSFGGPQAQTDTRASLEILMVCSKSPLAPVEAFQLRVFLHRMQGGLGPQIAQQRVALLGHLPQSLSLPAAVLTRDHPDEAGHLVGGGEATRVAEKYLGRQSGHGTHTWMR